MLHCNMNTLIYFYKCIVLLILILLPKQHFECITYICNSVFFKTKVKELNTSPSTGDHLKFQIYQVHFSSSKH